MLFGILAQATTDTAPQTGIDIDAIIEKVTVIGADYGLKILAALAIFILGRIATRIIVSIVERVMKKRKVDPSIQSFTTNLLSIALIAFIIISILGKLGVQTTSLVAVVGAAGLAVGLALQGSLANFAAGFLIIVFKPFKTNDFVEANGVSGVIERINIFTTELRTPDNKVVIVPNSKMIDNNIVNYSSAGKRRVDLVVGISYDANIDDARKILMDIMESNENVLKEPVPMVGVLELADSSVNLAVRPWSTIEDYWGVYFDTLETVKKRFDEAGIGIPFPQHDVHLFQEGK